MNRNALSLLACCLAAGLSSTAILGAAPESDAAIAARVEALPAESKQQLAQQMARFNKLPAAEKEQLRTLYANLVASPDANENLDVMARFSSWFQGLQPEERLLFRNVTRPDERLVLVKRVLEMQRKKEAQLAEQERFEAWKKKVNALTPHDAVVIYEWMKSFVTRNRTRIAASLPPLVKPRFDSITDEEKQLRILMSAVFLRFPGAENVRPERTEFMSVTEKLSPSTKQLLEQQPDQEKRHELFHAWVLKVFWEKTHPGVTDEALEEFLQQRIPMKMRLILEAQPLEEREHNVRQIYTITQALGMRPGEWEERAMETGTGPTTRPFNFMQRFGMPPPRPGEGPRPGDAPRFPPPGK